MELDIFEFQIKKHKAKQNQSFYNIIDWNLTIFLSADPEQGIPA
jgi:hypothetical protein